MLPAAMTFARASPPLFLVLITGLMVAACVIEGRAEALRRRILQAAGSPQGLILGSCVLYVAASVAWTPEPAFARAVEHLLHILGVTASLVVLWCAITIDGEPAWRTAGMDPTRTMAWGVVAAAVLTIAHFAFDGALNAAVGAATEDFRLNRAAVAMTLLIPIVAPALWRDGTKGAALALASLAVIAVWMSESASAKLASLVVVGVGIGASVAPRSTFAAVAGLTLAALLFAPLYTIGLNAIIPPAVHEAVGYKSLTIRGEIWGEFARLISHAPLLGQGLEASNVVQHTRLVDGLPADRVALLSWGHPHNAALQIWFELGVVGVMLAALAIGCAFYGFAARTGTALRDLTALTAAIVAISFVSHGAWQAWWLSLVGIAGVAGATSAASKRR